MKMTLLSNISAPPVGSMRAALYLADSSALRACVRHAEYAGVRVVTMIDESVPSVGLAGSSLKALIGRMVKGEFEVILAHTGDDLVTIGLSVQVGQGGAGNE